MGGDKVLFAKHSLEPWYQIVKCVCKVNDKEGKHGDEEAVHRYLCHLAVLVVSCEFWGNARSGDALALAPTLLKVLQRPTPCHFENARHAHYTDPVQYLRISSFTNKLTH